MYGGNLMIKSRYNTGLLRMIIVALAVILQVFLISFLVISLRQQSLTMYYVLAAIGLVEILVLSEPNRSPAYTFTWMIVILVLPIIGHLLYLLWGKAPTYSRKSKAMRALMLEPIRRPIEDTEVEKQFIEKYPDKKRIWGYLTREGFPLYEGTQSKYYPLGEHQFEDMIRDMEKAERFIFIEYFIIGKGHLWSRIYGILRKKAAEGVEVRVFYDDFGSLIVLPPELMKKNKDGLIQVQAFNPVHKYVSRLYLNYRNHQKIVVIDGNVGYMGGTNLADEYVNLYEKHGHWKDTALRMEGDAVWSLTCIFLKMWQAASGGEKEDSLRYKPTVKLENDGYYQPFCDGPVNQPHNPAESMYKHVISSAKEYVYITTPYLVIDDAMINELCLAARSGVDVRIITPRIWDKWYVHMVTHSNYRALMEAGVRIYEYTPGYIHAKSVLSDDVHGVMGSINMDYRSFYLHFEDGVWVCGSKALKDLKEDMLKTFNVSEEHHLDNWNGRPWYMKLVQGFFRLFAPLL